MSGRQRALNKRCLTGAGCFAAALSVCLVWGYQLERDDHLTLHTASFLLILLLAAVLTAAVYGALMKLHAVRFPQIFFSAPGQQAGTKDGSLKRMFLTRWAALFCCQLPVFLGVFPGFFVYDASDELQQVITRQFTTHHPLLHVLTMGGTVQGVYKLTGSYNAGIAVCILLQALVICAAFAAVLTGLKAAGVRKGWRIAAFCILGLFPPVVMFTLCSAKDGIFSAAVLAALFFGIRWFDLKEAFFHNRREPEAFLILVTVTLTYRNNAVYAWAVFAALCAAGWLYRYRHGRVPEHHLVQAGLLLAGPLMLALLIHALLAAAVHASDPHHQEALTVPIQQLARVRHYTPEAFDEAELETLHTYLPEESLRLYRPRLADPVKAGFQNRAFEADNLSFYGLWLRKGTEHPAAYLNAWLLTSYGYWYPFAVNNVYAGNEVFTFTYTDSSYFGYEVEAPGERHSLIPVIDRFYRWLSIERSVQEIPVISLLFAPAFYFWLLAFAALFLLTGEDAHTRRRAVLFLPLFLYYLTLLLGPTYLLRYVVILVETIVLLPLLLWDGAGTKRTGSVSGPGRG